MQPEVRDEYRRLRGLGFTAQWALHDAVANVRFDELHGRGFVRIRALPDHLHTTDRDIDDLAGTHATPHQLRELRRRVETDGIFGIISEHRCSCCKSWIVADSVWGFIGDDWKDSGYDADLKRAALHQYTEEWLNQRRRTPAGVPRGEDGDDGDGPAPQGS